jgi:hypothetical protein
MLKPFRAPQFLLVVLLLASAPPAAAASPPSLATGFRLLYEMRFEEGRSQFRSWEREHSEDPLGHAWEAASYLFEEFYRQGVLTSEFFRDDRKFLDGIKGKPNPEYRSAFLAANMVAQNLAKQRLAADSQDVEALFALTITSGMRADYASLIDRRQIESLKFIRESETYGRKLLAAKPDAADAYLALGAANYIIGSLPAHKRFLLFLGGVRGDRKLGMSQLAMAATQGNYLRPFAKILLALVALREGQVDLARTELQELTAEFPRSPLFAHELALLERAPLGHYVVPKVASAGASE